MIRIGLFFIFAPLAAIELLFYHHFGIILVGSLYFGLAMQADWAAARFLRRGHEEDERSSSSVRGAKRRHWSEDDPEQTGEELRVHKLGGGKKIIEPDNTWVPPPATPLQAAPAPEPVQRQSAWRNTARERRRERAGLPASPNFCGSAHEILGVDEAAGTRTIGNAFRHWIKRFHPDRAQELPAQLACAKVQQLTDARDFLLERRRTRKAA